MSVLVFNWGKFEAVEGHMPTCWTCWVLASDQQEFINWMHQSMVGEFTAAPGDFLGTKYVAVRINNTDDAMLFKLTWETG